MILSWRKAKQQKKSAEKLPAMSEERNSQHFSLKMCIEERKFHVKKKQQNAIISYVIAINIYEKIYQEFFSLQSKASTKFKLPTVGYNGQ